MRYHFQVLSAVALAGCAVHGAAPTVAVQTPAAPQFDIELMKDTVKTLSSDAFEGRAPSTAAEPKVLDAIIARLKAAGLKPGNNGSWLQEVPTVEITADTVSPLTVSGGTAPLSFRYGTDFVVGSYRAVPQTRIAASDIVFVGYGINAPELGWNDYAGIDMKGKTALILVNDPDWASEGEAGPFKGRRMTYYGRWTYKFEEAARQGATAALVIHDTYPAAYGWSVVNSSWTGPQYYVASGNEGMDQTVANGWVQKPVAEAILASAGKDLAAMSESARQKGFRAVPLGLKANLSFDNAIRKSTSHNVIGILPGTAARDEYVLYSAHWDHLGRCTPDATGDDICNGAVDNATGIGGLVGIAKANAQAGPARRSQVFVALTLEESGLLGSEWYAAHPVYPLARTVGGVNMDGLAPGGRARDYAMTGGDKSDLTTLFRRTLASMGLVEAPEEHPERGSYYRSDHFSMAKRGVPMLDIGRGDDLVEGGKPAGEAASQDYLEHRYHAPADEYAETWDWSGILQDTTLFYAIGRTLAEGSDWPNWNKDDEFRAARDQSRAGAR